MAQVSVEQAEHSRWEPRAVVKTEVGIIMYNHNPERCFLNIVHVYRHR